MAECRTQFGQATVGRNSERPESVASPAFVEFPGLLIVRLMSRCNQKCVFCMVSDEIDGAGDVPFEEASRRIGTMPPGSRIEFFGGEPTMHPDFVGLMRLARKYGHRCSLATNGRIFADAAFTEQLARLDATMIYVRSSLYGDTPALHDYHTGVGGSFEQLSEGVRNLVGARFECQINVLIMAGNFARLSPMVRVLDSWGVRHVKFGNLMDVESCGEHAARLGAVRPQLESAIELAERIEMRVTVEKTPVCVASGRVDLMSTERDLGMWPRRYHDEDVCDGCLVRPWCDGLDPGYVTRFAYDGLRRVVSVPAIVVGRSELAPEFLRTHCVEIPNEELDERAAERLNALWQEVQLQYGRLAVFPSRYIESRGPH